MTFAKGAVGTCTTDAITFNVGACQDSVAGSNIKYTAVTPNVTCTPNTATPSGSAQPKDPITFCCLP